VLITCHLNMNYYISFGNLHHVETKEKLRNYNVYHNEIQRTFSLSDVDIISVSSSRYVFSKLYTHLNRFSLFMYWYICGSVFDYID